MSERMVDGRLRGACMDEAPDGTPEKPWPTWQDVPEGVKYAGVDDGGQLAYINCGGVRYLLNGVSSCSTDSDMAAIARLCVWTEARHDGSSTCTP
ncbi:hypothetical protein GS860_02035 [Rhodococcus hoagii]|nr:hypothetical protein [Prescottella equi]